MSNIVKKRLLVTVIAAILALSGGIVYAAQDFHTPVYYTYEGYEAGRMDKIIFSNHSYVNNVI